MERILPAAPEPGRLARFRIEADPRLPAVEIPVGVWNEVCSHARETFPEECCGLMSGVREDIFRTVHRCRNEMTREHRNDPVGFPRDGRTGFFMNESDYFSAIRGVEEDHEEVTAIYHSHVGAAAYFSELDQECVLQGLFPFPDVEHVVISIVEGVVKGLAAFRKEGLPSRFVGRILRTVP